MHSIRGERRDGATGGRDESARGFSFRVIALWTAYLVVLRRLVVLNVSLERRAGSARSGRCTPRARTGKQSAKSTKVLGRHGGRWATSRRELRRMPATTRRRARGTAHARVFDRTHERVTSILRDLREDVRTFLRARDRRVSRRRRVKSGLGRRGVQTEGVRARGGRPSPRFARPGLPEDGRTSLGERGNRARTRARGENNSKLLDTNFQNQATTMSCAATAMNAR